MKAFTIYVAGDPYALAGGRGPASRGRGMMGFTIYVCTALPTVVRHVTQRCPKCGAEAKSYRGVTTEPSDGSETTRYETMWACGAPGDMCNWHSHPIGGRR